MKRFDFGLNPGQVAEQLGILGMLMWLVLAFSLGVLAGCSASTYTEPKGQYTEPKCNGLECIGGHGRLLLGEDLFAVRVLAEQDGRLVQDYQHIPEGSIVWLYEGVE